MAVTVKATHDSPSAFGVTVCKCDPLCVQIVHACV